MLGRWLCGAPFVNNLLLFTFFNCVFVVILLFFTVASSRGFCLQGKEKVSLGEDEDAMNVE